MIPPAYPIRFSSTIHIVPEKDFERTYREKEYVRRDLCPDFPWTSAERASIVKEAVTYEARVCNAGGFTNGDHFTLFHLCPYNRLWDPAPGNETWSDIEQILGEDIHTLKAENPEVRAFLSGGRHDDGLSQQLRRSLLMLFEKYNIPCTVLWGSDSPNNIHYDTQTDTWTLSTIQAPKDAEELKQQFPQIQIDKGDRLFIGEKEIKASEVTAE